MSSGSFFYRHIYFSLADVWPRESINQCLNRALMKASMLPDMAATVALSNRPKFQMRGWNNDGWTPSAPSVAPDPRQTWSRSNPPCARCRRLRSDRTGSGSQKTMAAETIGSMHARVRTAKNWQSDRGFLRFEGNTKCPELRPFSEGKGPHSQELQKNRPKIVTAPGPCQY